MQTNAKDALSDSDIDLLNDLLCDLSELTPCVNCETLDGMCAAISTMVRPIADTEILSMLVGDEAAFKLINDNQADPRYAGDSELFKLIRRRIHHSERAFSNTTLSDLSDPRAYKPYVLDGEALAQTDSEIAAAVAAGEFPKLGEDWATGFVTVVEHMDEDWRSDDELLDAEINPMLAPFYALVLNRDEWPEDISDEDLEGDTREAWLAQSIWACYELWEYWRYHAPKPKGVPFVKTHTPGRNDPCDCGSGKKYKQCHG